MNHELSGPSGVLTVGPLQITVTPLSLVEERRLRRLLRQEAAVAMGDYFTRCAGLLKAMAAQPAAYFKAVETITTLTATGPLISDEQYLEYRETPAAVACELYYRGCKATPNLTLEGLRAVVTDTNVDDLIDQLDRLMAGGTPKKDLTPPASPS